MRDWAARFIYLLLPMLLASMQAIADELPHDQDEARDQVRALAQKAAHLIKDMIELESVSELSSSEGQIALRKRMFDFRSSAMEMVDAAKKFEESEYREKSKTDARAKRHWFKDGVSWSAGLLTATSSAVAMAYWSAHGHEDIPKMIENGAAGALIGGVLGAMGGVLIISPIADGIDDWLLSRRIPNSDFFFEELRRNGIKVPDSNREAWFNFAIANISHELLVQDSPSLVEGQIKHLQAAIQAVVNLLESDPTLKAAFASLSEVLPATKGFKRLLRPKTWRDQAYLQYLQVRNEFARLCEKHELINRGYSFKRDFQRSLDVELKRMSITEARGTDFFKIEDAVTQRFLTQCKDTFLTLSMLELLHKSKGALGLRISAKVIEKADAKLRPAGIAEFTAQITVQEIAEPIVIQFPFTTRVAGDGNIRALIKEGNWRAPLEAAISLTLENHPRVSELLKTQARVEACAAQVMPDAAVAADSAAETEALAEEEAATAKAQMKGR